MAKKPQKGKFKYNLASVLKVRLIRETQEKEKFAETQKRLEEEQRKEREIKDQYRGAQNSLRSSFEEDNIDFTTVFLRQNQVEKLKEDVEVQKTKTVKAFDVNEEQRERLVESIKDKQIIEKDKDHKKQAWRDLMKKEEMKFIDEIATSKFNMNEDEY